MLTAKTKYTSLALIMSGLMLAAYCNGRAHERIVTIETRYRVPVIVPACDMLQADASAYEKKIALRVAARALKPAPIPQHKPKVNP